MVGVREDRRFRHRCRPAKIADLAQLLPCRDFRRSA